MTKHPKIKVQPSKLERVFNLLSLLLLIGSFVYAIQAYNSLPETIATHFDAKGEANGWGSKSIVFVMPIIAIVCFVPMYFLSKAPHVFNYMVEVTEDNAPRIYPVARLFIAVINFEIVLIFATITWHIVQSASGDFTLGIWFVLFVILVPLATIVYFVIRMNKAAKM